VLRDWRASGRSEAFVSTPEFAVWLLVLGAQAAIWVWAAVYVATTVSRRRRDLTRRRALPPATSFAIVAWAVAPLLLVLAVLFGSRLGLYDAPDLLHLPQGEEWPLPDHETKMLPFVATAVLIGLAAIAGMGLTTVAFRQLERQAKPRAAWVERFVALRGELNGLLAVAATLIGLATLTSGALRQAVLAVADEPVYRDRAVACLVREAPAGPEGAATERSVRLQLDELLAAYPQCAQLEFDERYVLMYGLLFSGVLAIAYTPSFLAMRRAGAVLGDRSFPLPGPRHADFLATVEKRRAFEALLETGLTASATFKAGIAILTPLAASLVSTLVPT
jgi:hypothetical protein